MKPADPVVLGPTDLQLLALRPYYDKLYGESPSYRAYMAKIAEAASKTPPK